MNKNIVLTLLGTMLAQSSLPAEAQVWTAKTLPAKLRPAACEQNRRSIIADRQTQTYKWALERKKSGHMNAQAKERLAFSEDMVREMRQLGCKNIP
jgi:hypothetical protein